MTVVIIIAQLPVSNNIAQLPGLGPEQCDYVNIFGPEPIPLVKPSTNVET